MNPTNLPQTEPFRCYTKYDSETIDTSDITDPGQRIEFIPYEPKITTWLAEFTPMNEAEIQTYTFKLSSADKLFSGQCIQFIFPENYDLLLLDETKVLTCTSPTISFEGCKHVNRIAEICLTQDIEIDETFEIVLHGVTNPNFETFGYIDIATTDSSGNVLQFTNNIALFESTQGAPAAPLTHISATSLDILVKADYELCFEVPGPIQLDALILIDFPKQFDIRGLSYSCLLGTNHDSVNLPYASGVTCNINNNLRRFEISGQTAAYADTVNPISLCYIIKEVENQKDTGNSFNFEMRVYDVSANLILHRTVGILDYPQNLTYVKTGLSIYVGAIPDIPIGTQSEDITVTLEKSVNYDITLTPSAIGFTFEPSSIEMKYYEGPTQTFKIIPNEGITAGTYAISWIKSENNQPDPPRFSELPETYFTVKNEPDFQQLQITLSQTLYKTPVDATSMPIYVYLSHKASKSLTVYYQTIQPFQPEFVTFTPNELVFEPGEDVKQFTYVATEGAVSGKIKFSLQPEFENLYYMPEDEINFEVQDLDNTPP